MRLLLDTRAVIRLLVDPQPLPPGAEAALRDQRTEPLVSVASVWEIALKVAVGKLEAPDDLLDLLAGHGVDLLAITAEHAYATRHLPLHHRDPFDRLLIAQAQAEHLPIVTGDPVFPAYDVRVIWS